jgi:predicted PhzF superfamily epimerase YddE/YHI9
MNMSSSGFPPFAIIDAFVEGPFSGNPAAVCLLPSWPHDNVLGVLAAEHNLSETAFLVGVGDGLWELRWFTPTNEVPLCGHATLAAAEFLWSVSGFDGETMVFRTRQRGELAVHRDGSLLRMDFPAQPAAEIEVKPRWIEHFGSLAAAGRTAGNYLLLEAGTPKIVADYVVDEAFLRSIEAFGIILTAPTGGSHPAFVSRFFAPRNGVLEDPVTGSAHCTLFPWWSEKLGQSRLQARQISRRGGLVEGHVREDRVELAGRCRIHVVGELRASL